MVDGVVPRRLHSSSMPRCFSATSSPRRIKGLTGRRFTGAALYAKGRKGAVGTRLTKNVGRGPPYNPVNTSLAALPFSQFTEFRAMRHALALILLSLTLIG